MFCRRYRTDLARYPLRVAPARGSIQLFYRENAMSQGKLGCITHLRMPLRGSILHHTAPLLVKGAELVQRQFHENPMRLEFRWNFTFGIRCYLFETSRTIETMGSRHESGAVQSNRVVANI